MKPEVTPVYNKAVRGGQISVLLETNPEVRMVVEASERRYRVQVHNKLFRAHMRAYIMHVLNGHMYGYVWRPLTCACVCVFERLSV